MEITFNVIKEERKALVTAVSEITGWKPVYKGAPSFAFAVDNYIIDKNGTLIFDERTAIENVRSLLAELAERGFTSEDSIDETISGEDVDAKVSDKLTIEIPIDGFTETALGNLEKLITGKSALIMKAIDTDSLQVEQTEKTLQFPWFPFSASSDEVDAYTRFICGLCDLAKKQKRVTIKETNVESEKFSFRCFLLRLGFIGKEYSSAREILLSNLSGNSSFKNGSQKQSAVPDSLAEALVDAELVHNVNALLEYETE